MKILVPIKRVVDANVNVRVKSDETGVDTNVKMSINPFCEIAVEEAVRMKEASKADEVVVVTIGDNKCQESLRTAMALGADRAIHIETEDALEPLAIAKLLKAVADDEQPDLIITGKQSIDGENNQTGQMLSALLGWSQGTFASEVTLNDNNIEVTREIDGGLEVLELQLPAVITTDLRLNEPRFATLPNIMKAKKKPIDVKDVASMGVDVSRRTNVVKVSPPPARAAGVKVNDVPELVKKLNDLKLT
jgi:electron transfer flavoprotein beta subunit